MKYSTIFEAIKDRASGKLNWEIAHCGNGIDATIEALKEMMVGEPIPMRLEHEDMGPKTSTFLVDMNDELHAVWHGYHGTDGEEVIVMVLRKK